VGDRIIRASWTSTAVFGVVAAAAAITGNRAIEVVSAGVDVALFLAGCVVFLVAYAKAVSRSREEEIAVAGVYLMMGNSAPKETRAHLLGSLAAQTAIAIVTAAIRWPLAFGILVPTLGLGLAGLWSATHGRFPARVVRTK
jgi:threonine/homoserine efflux transporter RhtA